MENLVKAAILFLTIFVVISWTTGRSRKGDRTKKAASNEPEVPLLTLHGYMTADSAASHNDIRSPTTHHGSDLGCGDASGGHHH
jgi:hypothetical protein